MAPIAKRRKLNDKHARVEELTFDPSARNEYLTGFHKRKEARKEHARAVAIQREKEEKVRERKQLREQRKEDLESHIAAVNDELRKQNAILNGDSTEGEDEEFEGFDDPEAVEELPDDAEYVDEDKYTTVTVEPMDQSEDGDDNKDITQKAASNIINGGMKEIKKKRPKDGDAKAKTKKKKFRYESKAERAVTRQKQKSKNRVAKARRKGE